MNTTIFRLITAITAVLFATVTSIAQEAKTMYIMKNGAVTHEVAVSNIDSIIFYNPAGTTPVIPENGVLINGVVWATRNVDEPGTFAATPESPGMLYQWNRKTAWAATGNITGWDNSYPSGTEWAKSNDPSPSGWRVPTLEEQQTLLDTDKVTSEWTNQNGVNGRKFTDKTTGASLFLPAVGCRYYSDGTLYVAGEDGHYWSSTQYYGNSGYAYDLSFHSGLAYWSYDLRSYGFSVRAVAE